MLESSSYSFHKLQICPLSEHVQQEDIQGLPLKFWFSHQISCFLKSPVADHILKFNFILLFPKWEAPVAHMLGRQLMAFCAALSKFRVKFSWLCRKPTSSSCETWLYGLQRYLPAVIWVPWREQGEGCEEPEWVAFLIVFQVFLQDMFFIGLHHFILRAVCTLIFLHLKANSLLPENNLPYTEMHQRCPTFTIKDNLEMCPFPYGWALIR